MSKNNTVKATPGLKRVVPKAETQYSLAVKVTGRNLAALSYIVSLEAARRGVTLALETTFDTDGSLVSIVVEDDTKPDVVLKPGRVVVLEHDRDESQVMWDYAYDRLYREL